MKRLDKEVLLLLCYHFCNWLYKCTDAPELGLKKMEAG